MIIKWEKSDQHTDLGLFKVGDVIDTTKRGIPDEAVLSWVRDGFAVKVKPGPEPKDESRPEKKKIAIGGQHG